MSWKSGCLLVGADYCRVMVMERPANQLDKRCFGQHWFPHWRGVLVSIG